MTTRTSSYLPVGLALAIAALVMTTVVANAKAAVATAAMSAPPSGSPAARSAGVFGAVISWPIVPIHVVLLPDGRVMSFGTNAAGRQGGQLVYDVWDPSLGTGTDSHMLLTNTTSTDIFCSAQSVMLSGDVLTSGGDLTVNALRNSATNQTTIFSPSANAISTNTAMTYARWYGTLIGLPNGNLAIFGGRQNVGKLTPIIAALTPEIYRPADRTWTSLVGATSSQAFNSNWYYPRVYVAPGGKVFVLTNYGKMFYVSTQNDGAITMARGSVPVGDLALPSVAFSPGKLLSVRMNREVVVIDFTTAAPRVSLTDSIDRVRYWSSGTVLADGRVLVTGGSAVAKQLTDAAFEAQIWDPNTGHWTTGASAVKPRLYHSMAMLMPDGSVLTGGGGAPGPVTNLNAEIYYPPYLYAADGSPAERPVILSTNSNYYDHGATLFATVRASDVISRLALVRTGSSTHSNNSDQQFVELTFSQVGQSLSATLPTDSSVLVPGFYMLFAINADGVPSVASLIRISSD